MHTASFPHSPLPSLLPSFLSFLLFIIKKLNIYECRENSTNNPQHTGTGHGVPVVSLGEQLVRKSLSLSRIIFSENCLDQGSTKGVEDSAPSVQWHPPRARLTVHHPPPTCTPREGPVPSPWKHHTEGWEGSLGSLRGGTCAGRTRTSPLSSHSIPSPTIAHSNPTASSSFSNPWNPSSPIQRKICSAANGRYA